MARVIEFLLLMWEIGIEFLTPSSGLGLLQAIVGNWGVNKHLQAFFSLCLYELITEVQVQGPNRHPVIGSVEKGEVSLFPP